MEEKAQKGPASVSIGQFAELAAAVISQLPREIDKSAAKMWIENQDHLKEVLKEALLKPTHIVIRVDYTKTIEEMVKAGRYNYYNPDIDSKNFPVAKRENGKVDVHLVHFDLDRQIGSNEAIGKLDIMGFRPAELLELLVLGAAYPELQRQFPIVALGSVSQSPTDSRYVPFLSSNICDRHLCLGWFDHSWFKDCRFAAVRKSNKSLMLDI
ncbi:MAG: hypothetical protein HYW70_01605 [Candidatus Nealsonbacteria bacterium]|nr:hypothetical protein [Candidatus Nealsonbacteria bacterium]